MVIKERSSSKILKKQEDYKYIKESQMNKTNGKNPWQH